MGVLVAALVAALLSPLVICTGIPLATGCYFMCTTGNCSTIYVQALLHSCSVILSTTIGKKLVCVFCSDEKLRHYLSSSIPDSRVIIAASQDDVTRGLVFEHC